MAIPVNPRKRNKKLLGLPAPRLGNEKDIFHFSRSTLPVKIKKTGTIENARESEALIKEKIQTLSKLVPKNDTTALAEVELQELKEKRGGYRVEINFSSHGDMYRVEAKRPTVRIAFDAALEDLRRELRRRKTKKVDFARNVARASKKRLKG